MSEQGLKDFFEAQTEALQRIEKHVTQEREAPPKGVSWRTVAAVVTAVVAVLGLTGAVAASVLATDAEAAAGDAAVLEKLNAVAQPLNALINDLNTRVTVLEDREKRRRGVARAEPEDP